MSNPTILDRFRLDGKVALITGGTRGIGLAIARAFGEVGAKLYLSARTENWEDDGALLKAGFDITFIAGDLSQPGEPARIVNAVLEDAGRLDVLVNNAGVAIHGDTPDFAEETWRRLMSLNVDAVFWACKAAIPAMVKNGGGTIVNMGSMSGIASNIPQNQVAMTLRAGPWLAARRKRVLERLASSAAARATASSRLRSDRSARAFSRSRVRAWTSCSSATAA